MSKFKVDLSKLVKKAYKLEDVKDQIVKVGFDLVRFKDIDKGAQLWQVQKADDGQYIVALYEESDEIKTSSNWSVSLNKLAGQIEISYKGDPLVKMATSKLGIPSNEIDKVKDYLPSKLAENKKLVKSLLNQLNESAKKEVLNKYPELN